MSDLLTLEAEENLLWKKAMEGVGRIERAELVKDWEERQTVRWNASHASTLAWDRACIATERRIAAEKEQADERPINTTL